MTGATSGMAELRDVARTLHRRIDARDATEVAWARLVHDGEVRPWSAAAEEAFDRRSADVDRSHHHRAVLHHARAYDLERAGDAAGAAPHWAAAVRHWVAVHRSDGFWARLRTEVGVAAGRDVAADVVTGVRARLPRYLLSVHVTLAAAARRTDAVAARRHMALVRGSGFPAADIDAACAELVPDLDNRVAAARTAVRYGPLLDEVVAWLDVDPAHPALVRALLVLTDSWALSLAGEPGWGDPVGRLLDRVEKALPDGYRTLRVRGATMDEAVGRFLFWRGTHLVTTRLEQSRGAERRAVEKGIARADRGRSLLREAVRLVPGVRLLPYEADRFVAKACAAQAALWLSLGRRDTARREATEALRLDPDNELAREVLGTVAPAPPAAEERVAEERVAEERVTEERVTADTLARHIVDKEIVKALEHLEQLAQRGGSPAQLRVVVQRALALDPQVRTHSLRRRRYDEVMSRLERQIAEEERG